MRRPRGGEEVELVDVNLARVLMLLSQRAAEAAAAEQLARGSDEIMEPERVFECKTCNRQFPSFQALGGHRASHKKPRLLDADGALLPKQPPKPRVHECSICGLEFALGQALGGHMRRHRAAAAAATSLSEATNVSTASTSQRVDEPGKKREITRGGTSVAQIRRPVLVLSAVLPPLDLNEPAAPLDGDRDPLELSLRTFAPEPSIVH